MDVLIVYGEEKRCFDVGGRWVSFGSFAGSKCVASVAETTTKGNCLFLLCGKYANTHNAVSQVEPPIPGS